jgi:hypothetical protein
MSQWIAVMAVLGLCFGLAGCDSFERGTMHTISASKAVADEAQEEYSAGVLPQSNATHDAITSLVKAQFVAADALLVYDDLAQKHEGAEALAAQRRVVQTAIEQMTASEVALSAYLPK